MKHMATPTQLMGAEILNSQQEPDCILPKDSLSESLVLLLCGLEAFFTLNSLTSSGHGDILCSGRASVELLLVLGCSGSDLVGGHTGRWHRRRFVINKSA